MELLIFVFLLLILLFGFVVFFGAPYVPTLKKQTDTALDLLNLQSGQTLLELGCGDGRLMLAASKRGIKTIGYELNPVLVLIAKVRLFKYRHLASVHLANFWQVRLPQADGVYVFLLEKYMKKLHKKIEQDYVTPVKLVSFAFKIPNKKPVQEKQGMRLYLYSRNSQGNQTLAQNDDVSYHKNNEDT